MIRNIIIGQYIPGESLLHKADPRVKIILTVLLSVIIFLVDTYMGFLIISLFILFIIMGSDIPIGYTLKGLRPVLFIIAFASLINIFTVSGRILFEYKFIHITYEGLDVSAKMALKLSLLIVGTSLLTLTTTPILLTDGIEKLLSPLKRLRVPVHEMAMMMTIALRFIPTLLEETDKIIKAQSARGADFDTGKLIDRAKSFIPVLVPLFVSAFRRAEELALAMEARCYRGGVGRTRMKQLELSRVDFIIITIMIIFSVFVLYIRNI